MQRRHHFSACGTVWNRAEEKRITHKGSRIKRVRLACSTLPDSMLPLVNKRGHCSSLQCKIKSGQRSDCLEDRFPWYDPITEPITLNDDASYCKCTHWVTSSGFCFYSHLSFKSLKDRRDCVVGCPGANCVGKYTWSCFQEQIRLDIIFVWTVPWIDCREQSEVIKCSTIYWFWLLFNKTAHLLLGKLQIIRAPARWVNFDINRSDFQQKLHHFPPVWALETINKTQSCV